MAVVTLACMGVAEIVLRAVGVVRNVGPAFVTYDAVYGRRLKSNACFISRSPEFTFAFTTNQWGLRDADWSERPRDVVLCLGDSFTMGYGVAAEDAFPCIVERSLLAERHAGVPTEVVNAGIGNAGNGHWVKFLTLEAALYSPKCVVLQMSANDFSDNTRERLFTCVDGRLVENEAPPPSWRWTVQEYVDAIPGLSHLHLVAMVRQALRVQQSQEVNPDARMVGDNLTWALLSRSLDLCRSNQWPVVVMWVGDDHEREETLRQLCAAYGAPLLLTPNRKQRPDLYYDIDGHWRPAGHEFVAKQLLAILHTVDIGSHNTGR